VKLIKKNLNILERNDEIAGHVNSEEYQAILKGEKELKGDCKQSVFMY